MLYTIIIYPLVQIIEIVYVLIHKIFDNPVLSIIGVSFTVTFLCLPLYVVAEKWQETERNSIKKLKPKVDKIKTVFSGDEQYMILSAYYRQNHYHPMYALRNSFGILIQIPFFIAAYTYLSHLESLRGVSFLFIRDMSAPDSFLTIGGFRVNILPILMTLINGASGAIYTKGFLARDKIQVYGMAAVFLALLYNSPAGLVLYWTMNNILSLAKNIFYKLKNPLKVLYIIISFSAAVFIAYLLFINDGALYKRIVVLCAASLIFFIPFFIKCNGYIQKSFFPQLLANDKRRAVLFVISCVTLAVLTGICIPAAVIASSPSEFSFIAPYESPLSFIYNSFLQALGFFVFWPLCIYLLFNKKIKTTLSALFFVLSLIGVANTFIFPGNYGVISNTFDFSTTGVLNASGAVTALNILSIVIIASAFLLLAKKNKTDIVSSSAGIILLAIGVFSSYNLIRIQSEYRELRVLQNTTQKDIHTITPVFSLSKDKPNVIVFMADCAINGFVKPVFEEHPQLKAQFDGFTLYPNTLSFALHTLMGSPPIWGGYEYTPKEMNKRSSIPMVEKHNEALLVLPRLLAGSGYQVTVTDPSFANYEWIPDIRIYDKYENITAFNTKGRYSGLWYTQNNFGQIGITSAKIKRNTLWFSFLKIAPPMLRKLIYDDGWYLSTADFVDGMTEFIDCYAVVDFLPELTIYDAKEPSALLISNETTHEPRFLQYPDYIPVEKVTDRGAGEYSGYAVYHANNAFYLKFGEWLTELKKNGVYDNTRIIIVSDHGAGVDAHLADTDIPIPGERRENYNPVLLIKDFNAQGELRTDMTFMTNADVPVLATKDIISDPVNPFTGNPVTTAPKNAGVYITTNHSSQVSSHGKYTLKIRDDQWVFVHDNIFDSNNWEKAEK